MSISVGKEKIDTHRSQIVVLCLQSGGFRTELLEEDAESESFGENRRIPPDSTDEQSRVARTEESHLKV